MIRVSQKNFSDSLTIISHLEYYWSVYNKENQLFDSRFQKTIINSLSSNIVDDLKLTKFSKLTKTAKISKKTFDNIEELVTITNTLEQFLIKNNTLKIYSENITLTGVPFEK